MTRKVMRRRVAEWEFNNSLSEEFCINKSICSKQSNDIIVAAITVVIYC